MQKKEGRNAGAFHYSLYLDTDEKQPRFVVGTTSKTIFTLLRMHEKLGDEKYLSSATKGADWLLKMIRDEGNVYAYSELEDDGKWMRGTKDSTLYNGQVLSALSRMYTATEDQKYLDGATKIANYLKAKVENEGCYIGDDYRKANPISSSWVVLALLDFHKASGDPEI